MARPCLLTPELAERVCNAIAAGHSWAGAAASAGIGYATLRTWLVRGEREPRGKFRTFLEAATRAREQALLALEKRGILDDPDPKAARWALERRWPLEWGRRVELSGAIAVPTLRELLQPRLDALPEKQLDAHVAALEAGARTLGLVP